MEHSHPNWGLHSLACRRPPWNPLELSAWLLCHNLDFQFSEGQANRQGQGLPGLAKQGWFAGFGDFEPAAVAGVAGLAERSPPAAGRVASQLLEGVGQLGWPLAQAAKPKRVDGAGGRRMAPHPSWFTPQRDRTGNATLPGPMAG